MTDGLWPIIAAMAAVTYLPRMLPLVVLSRVPLAEGVRRWLGFVPVAVLSALLARELFATDGRVRFDVGDPLLAGALIAFGLALWTRNLMLTVLGGVVTAALLRFAFG